MCKQVINSQLNLTIDSLLLGLLGVTMLSSIWMFFGALNWKWSLFLIAIVVFTSLLNRHVLLDKIYRRKKLWMSTSFIIKLFSLVVIFRNRFLFLVTSLYD